LARAAVQRGSTSRHSPWSKPIDHLHNAPLNPSPNDFAEFILAARFARTRGLNRSTLPQGEGEASFIE
jgi:hypothetical protein